MKPRIENLQRTLRSEAKKWDRKARDAGNKALREYYRGRAEGARQAAGSLDKFTYDGADNPYTRET